MHLPDTVPTSRSRRTGHPRRHHLVNRQNSAPPVRAVIDVLRVARVVQSHLLLAEDRLQAGQLLEADHRCRAAVSAVAAIMAVEPELRAAALAVNAHVSVVAGRPTAVEAVRRYYAVAVDRALAGVGERLVYATGLRAVLLAATRPTLAADTLNALLQQQPADPAIAEMLAQALIAVYDVRPDGPAAPGGPPPLMPGGAHLTPWAAPDPRCLSWLIHVVAPPVSFAGLAAGRAARPRGA